jgi:hypothetical protein
MVGQGSYLLEATMSVRKKDHGPPDQWIGELALPAVAIEVPASLFAVN